MVPVLFGREIITVVYGSTYAKAYPILALSLFFAYIKTLTIPYQNYLFANNRFKDFNQTSILFAIAIITSTLLFAFIDLFGDLTISVAAGLVLSCIIERIVFVQKASNINRQIKFFFHPSIIIFFTSIVAGWFMLNYFLPENLYLSYGVRIMILAAIIPLGFLFKVYVAEDFYAILKLVNMGPRAKNKVAEV